MQMISYFTLFCSTFVNKGTIKTSRFFFICYIMKNLQKNLNIIWQPPLLDKSPPYLALPIPPPHTPCTPLYEGGGVQIMIDPPLHTCIGHWG